MEQFHNNSMIIYFADHYILVSSKSWSHYNSVVIQFLKNSDQKQYEFFKKSVVI